MDIIRGIFGVREGSVGKLIDHSDALVHPGEIRTLKKAEDQFKLPQSQEKFAVVVGRQVEAGLNDPDFRGNKAIERAKSLILRKDGQGAYNRGCGVNIGELLLNTDIPRVCCALNKDPQTGQFTLELLSDKIYCQVTTSSESRTIRYDYTIDEHDYPTEIDVGHPSNLRFFSVGSEQPFFDVVATRGDNTKVDMFQVRPPKRFKDG